MRLFILTKAKRATEGEVRTRKDGSKWRKTGKTWTRVRGEHQNKKEDEKEKETTKKELDNKGSKSKQDKKERNTKLVLAAKMGATVPELSKETGMSVPQIRQVLKQAMNMGLLKEIKRPRKHPPKLDLQKDIFNYETRKKQKGKVTKLKEIRNPKEQPYKNDKIAPVIIARASITQQAKNNYISEDLMETMRPHQIDGVNLMMEKFFEGEKSGINVDSTGGGKTTSALGIAATYLDHNPKAKILIVTENDRIIASSFGKDAKRMKIGIKPVKKIGEISEPGIYITSYKDLHNLEGDFENITFGVFDEIHNLRNSEISRKARLGIRLMKSCKNTAMFSATPVDKAAHMMYLCQAFDLSFKKTMKFLGFKKIQGQWSTNLSYKEIAERYDSIFREFTKKGLMVKREVPLDGLNMHTETVKLSPDYQSRYDALLEKMNKQLQVAEGKGKGLLKAQFLMKLRALLEESKIDHSMEVLQKAIKDGKQVVLFADRVNDAVIKDNANNHISKYSTGTLKELQRRLEKEGIKHSILFGSKKDGKDEIDKFQKGEHQVFITTPKSGSTGISLDDIKGDKPRLAIMMSAPFSAVEFIQIPGRIHRLTTKSKTEMMLMSTDTAIEKWNTNIIANKLNTLGASVKGDYSALSMEDLAKAEDMTPEENEKYFKDKKEAMNTSIPSRGTEEFNLNDYKGSEALKKAMQLNHGLFMWLKHKKY